MKNLPSIVVQLIHITGPLKGEIQEYTGETISIGRDPSSHLRFPADLAAVSRKHAEIVREGNKFRLLDRSTNGTMVNGKRISETYLKNGDVVEFSPGGPKVSFLTEIRERLAEPEPEPKVRRREAPVAAPPERPQRLLEGKSLPAPPVEGTEGRMAQKTAARLTIQYGPTIRTFTEMPVTIGKSPKCDFLLNHPAVSEQHAQIFVNQNQYWVKDLTGQRLIQVNRQPIGSEVSLSINDDIALTPRGPYLRFLGEGRLAEVSDPSEAESSRQGVEGEEARQDRNREKPSKGLLSKFRRTL